MVPSKVLLIFFAFTVTIQMAQSKCQKNYGNHLRVFINCFYCMLNYSMPDIIYLSNIPA